MLVNLLLGLSTMAVCLMFQSILLIVALRYYSNHMYLVNSPSLISSLIVVNSVMMLLIIGNLAQLTIWAIIFWILGEFSELREAIYHSAVNFATLGYGDFVMSDQHKFLGPLEAINGVLMIGVTTATLMSVFQDTMRKTMDARNIQKP
jgi:hypothetical protein